jgi:hypothetical protein
MSNQRQYNPFLAALLLFVAAKAGHWLITPINHPGASSARVAAVWVQLLAGIALAIWVWRRREKTERA